MMQKMKREETEKEEKREHVEHKNRGDNPLTKNINLEKDFYEGP